MAIHWTPKTPESLRVTHEGRVIKVYQRDYRAMSDVYTFAVFALVQEDDGSFKEHMVNANFECDNSGSFAREDASPELLAAYQAHLDAVEAARVQRIRDWEARESRDRARVAAVSKRGTRVRFVAACRPKRLSGVEGEVFWSRDGRIGVATSDRRDARGHHLDVEWTSAKNLEVV